jgi:2-oxo-4-hydroxy-4-carboxy--5-ureidoimidazoline (OHCU) decarboxylase
VSTTRLVDPATLGDLDRPTLAAALRPLWEDAGPLVDRLLGQPVTTWEQHLVAAEAAVADMDPATRADLLGAHPRIGADSAALAARSPESWAEQGGAAPTDAATAAALDAANDTYEARFGFPFVEFVAGRPKAEILPLIAARLARDRTTELDAGCAALVAIARDRLARLRSDPS